MFAFVPIFWTLFDQTNSTWVLQGEQMRAVNFLGLDIGAEQMQSMNPLIVMVLVPLFTLGIYPRIGRFASPLKRMSFGMFLACASYLIVAALQTRIDKTARISAPCGRPSPISSSPPPRCCSPPPVWNSPSARPRRK